MTIHLTDRVWIYDEPGGWDWRRFHFLYRGGDEYGRRTILLRLPGGRALVWAWRTCHCKDCDLMRAQTLQFAEEIRKIADVYGVDEDAVLDLPDEAWDRALFAHDAAEKIEKVTGRTVLPWQRRVMAENWGKAEKECRCPEWGCDLHGDPGMG